MSRVGILTFLHNENYGSSLQAYALQRVVRSLGHEVEHLDYCPDQKEKIRNMILSGNSPKLILAGIRKRRVGKGQESARSKKRAIADFYARRMRLSPLCRNRKELEGASGRYSVLLCGSDQIWNPVWLNPVYFLNFGGKKIRRIAYAPSLGVREMPPGKKIRRMRKLISGFQAVSVREEEGADLLERITGTRPAVLPDPVCLLTAEQWRETAGPQPGGTPYLLCYFIGENPLYWEKAEQAARERGLRILTIPVTGEAYGKPFERLEGCGPEAFLAAIDGAGAICTDSFHGLVFGTIFQKDVILCRRDREDDPENKNSRIDHFRRTVARKGLQTLRQEGLLWLRDRLEE